MNMRTTLPAALIIAIGLAAAGWLAGQEAGLYDMQDVLGL